MHAATSANGGQPSRSTRMYACGACASLLACALCTADNFKELCQRAKSLLDKRSGDGLASRIVLLDNWNEFGEGHYIFPTRQYGFGYLDAVRDVFAVDSPPHVDLTPADIGRGPYDSQYRALQSGTGASD